MRVFLLIFFISLSFNAYASERMAGTSHKKNQKLSTISGNIGNIENIGYKIYGFPRDIWKNSKKSDIYELINALPDNPRSYYLADLSKKVLMSGIRIKTIDNDYISKAGDDLFTLRINKLLSSGFVKEANDLYKKVGDKPYHPKLAEAGLKSYIFNGSLATACLENNYLSDLYEEKGTFLDDLSNICSLMYQDKESSIPTDEIKSRYIKNTFKSENYRVNLTDKNIEKISPMELSVLLHADRLDIDRKSFSKILKKATNLKIYILMNSDKLSNEMRLKSAVSLTARGIISPERLGKFYINISENIDKRNNLSSIETIALDYRDKMTNKLEKDLSKKITIDNFVKYSPFIEHMKTDEIVKNNSPIDSLRIIAFSDYSKIRSVLNKISDTKITDNNSKIDIFSLMTIAKLHNFDIKNIEIDSMVSKLLNSKNKKKVLIDIIFLQMLDKDEDSVENAFQVYDKQTGLTYYEKYTMPSISIINRLEESIRNDKVGEFVILSILLFHNQKSEAIYPLLIRDVVNGFVKVGLKNEVLKMATHTILGDL